MLATLGVPFDPDAASYAVDTAVESGQPLIVANVTQLEPLPMSLRLGYDALEEFTPEVTESVKRPVELASSLGIRVERIRVRSPRPIRPRQVARRCRRRPWRRCRGRRRRGRSRYGAVVVVGTGGAGV